MLASGTMMFRTSDGIIGLGCRATIRQTGKRVRLHIANTCIAWNEQ